MENKLHPVQRAPAPWTTRAESYLLFLKMATLPEGVYDALEEAWEDEAMGRFESGLGAVMIVRYTETPVGRLHSLCFAWRCGCVDCCECLSLWLKTVRCRYTAVLGVLSLRFLMFMCVKMIYGDMIIAALDMSSVLSGSMKLVSQATVCAKSRSMIERKMQEPMRVGEGLENLADSDVFSSYSHTSDTSNLRDHCTARLGLPLRLSNTDTTRPL